MGEIVGELGKLVEDDVGGVLGERVAGVVDLLDVALRARRPDDVLGLVDPALQPLEALGAHALGQHRDAAAAENAPDSDAAPAVVPGRRPDRPVPLGVELAGDEARNQTGIGRQHLMSADHREPVAERDRDRRIDPGELAPQDDVPRCRHGAGAVLAVEPVNTEQIGRAGLGRIEARGLGGDGVGNQRGIGEL